MPCTTLVAVYWLVFMFKVTPELTVEACPPQPLVMFNKLSYALVENCHGWPLLVECHDWLPVRPEGSQAPTVGVKV